MRQVGGLICMCILIEKSFLHTEIKNMPIIEIISKEEISDLIETTIVKVLANKQLQEEVNNKLLNREQAAKYLDISLGTLHTHTKTGKIRGQRIGGRLLYRKSDLDNSTTSTNK